MKNVLKSIAAMALILLCALSMASPVLAQEDAEAKIVKHFNFMDKNKDGVIGEDEFKMMGQDYKTKFQEADADKNGTMTLEEFKAWEAKQGEAGMKM